MADKKRIKLKDFFATGALDCASLGQSKEWVAQHFPAPEEEPYESFGEPDAIPVRKAVEELNTERMEFSIVRNPVWVENSVTIELAKSHVCLLFEAEDDGQNTNDLKLQAFYTK